MSARILGILTLLLTLLAAPAVAAPTAEPPGRRDPSVPGPGSYLALVDHGTRGDHGVEPARQRLVLVDRDGTQHVVLSRPAGGYRTMRLVDWSPDGSTALLLTGREGHLRAITVDVVTGWSMTTRVPSDAASVVLSPDTGGLLVAAFGDRTGEPLSLVARDGTRTRLAARMTGTLLPSLDGSTLLTNGAHWRARVMRVLSATDGSVVRRVAVDGRCQPVRWWGGDRALLTCGADLALLDLATGDFRRLTSRHDAGDGDLGHLDARRIDGGLYVQVAGGCGEQFLGRRERGGRVTPVDVPGAVGNVLLLGGTRDRLVVQHAQSCEGAAPRSVIARLDPATGHERTLVRLPRSEDFGAVLAHGERQPLGY